MTKCAIQQRLSTYLSELLSPGRLSTLARLSCRVGTSDVSVMPGRYIGLLGPPRDCYVIREKRTHDGKDMLR